MTIAIGIIRAKAMAVLLGPAGVGLMGLFGSVMDLAISIVGMGINSSGVRQIAATAGSGEAARTARTAMVLRRVSILLGVLGGLLLVVLCKPVSKWTFGNAEYAGPVALLGFAVLFRTVSDGQAALIQGLRRIADLARIAVIGGLLGTIISLTLVYFLRERGVVPSLIGVTATTLIVSWWYRRKIEIPAVSVSSSQMREETSALLKLGAAFMASGIMTMGSAWVIRIIVRGAGGEESAGLYQSAWVLGGLYVGFILQAMGSDFYPRLTAVASKHPECNRLVNEQAEISLLLMGPGVIGTLTFAPLVIAVFYTSKFSGAVEPLRWICLGMALRVIAWPMGFIILAKGAQSIFFLTEIAATVVHVGLAYLLVDLFELPGATMAFFGLYVWHGVLIYLIVRRLTGFRWSEANRRTGRLFLSLIAMVFISCYTLPFWVATSLGIVALLVSAVYSFRVLLKLVPFDRLPGPIRWLVNRFYPALTRAGK